jgi:hypothetical protein
MLLYIGLKFWRRKYCVFYLTCSASCSEEAARSVLIQNQPEDRHGSGFLCEWHSRPDSACVLSIKSSAFRISDVHWEKPGSLRNAFISAYGRWLLVTAAGTTPHSMGPPFLALLNDFIPWQFLAVSADFNTGERRCVVVTAWVRNSAKKLVFLAHIPCGKQGSVCRSLLDNCSLASSTLKMEAGSSSETLTNFSQTTLSHIIEGSVLHVFRDFPQLLKTNGVILSRGGPQATHFLSLSSSSFTKWSRH